MKKNKIIIDKEGFVRDEKLHRFEIWTFIDNNGLKISREVDKQVWIKVRNKTVIIFYGVRNLITNNLQKSVGIIK